MGTLLVKNAEVLVTMDGDRRELRGGGFFARDGWIERVGESGDLPDIADDVLDARGHVVVPGLVNTHHHFYQTLTRAVPAAQDAGLFTWLQTLYPIWAKLTPADIGISTRVALAELALSGCTTASDHLYLFPNGSRLDDEIEAAAGMGLRLHASRGSMSLGESSGGLPPDSVVEDGDAILADTRRLIDAYHDPERGSMVRVVVAPCSPFSVTTELMRESAALARDTGVTMHTHLAETMDEEAFCLDRFGLKPFAYAESVDWRGPDVWFAHAVFPGDGGVEWLASSGTGVAHCPTSNMRLASGIAPLAAYLDAGVRVGLGVDGSASNDGSHLLGEARQAMLLARVAAASGDDVFGVRHALETATRGGAAVLGRDDIGSLETGKCADFAAFSLDHLTYAGALHDPVAALLLCAPQQANHVYVHGKAVVEHGDLLTAEVPRLVEQQNEAARRLADS